MGKIYEFIKSHKWMLWTFLVLTTSLFTYYGAHCHLEEDIFKLLPQTDDEKAAIAFTNIKMKDKVMVQAVRCEGVDNDSVDNETLSLAMDLFMERVFEADSSSHILQDALYQIDPYVLLEIGTYVLEHGAAYLDFEEEEMDSLLSEEHVREQIHMYLELLETEVGEQLYDIIAYDPCGIAIKNLDMSTLLASTPEESVFQYSHLFSGKGQACIGFITPSFGPNESTTASKMLRYFREAQDELQETYPGVEIMYHGTVVLAAYNSDMIRRDIFTTLAIAIIICLLLLLFCLKHPRYLLLLLFPIAFGAVFSLSGIYWGRGWMSLMALGLGVIVFGVALSYCLHVLIHYVYTGDVRFTVKEQSKPVFLGALTTIGAFAGLMFTQSSLLQDFGIFALLTILGTTFISLIAMPHFFPKKNTPNKKAFHLLEAVNAYRIDRNTPICIAVVVWVVVCICFCGQYQFDSNLRHIGYISPETQHAMDNWDANQNQGMQQQYFAAVGSTLNEALEQLSDIEEIEDSLYAEGIISKPLYMSGIMPSLSLQEERIEHWRQYFTPAKQQMAWRNIYQACVEEGIDPDMFEPFREIMASPSEPDLIAEAGILPDEILGNFIEDIHGTILVYLSVKSNSEHMLDVKRALTDDDRSLVLDPYYYSTNLVELIRDDFNMIMLISAIFVLILLLITYRNVWIALIAFLPMVLSWYTVLGAMAIFHQPFNLINIVVSSFIFGIGVDYSIFIMDGLMKGDKSKAMVYHKTAITLSAFVLVLCMFSLFFATHPAINSIAFASVTGMITTLMLSYTIQPRLYRTYIRIKATGVKGFINHYMNKSKRNTQKRHINNTQK